MEAQYVLKTHCLACNREPHQQACQLCSRIEYAERKATGTRSPQLLRFTSRANTQQAA